MGPVAVDRSHRVGADHGVRVRRRQPDHQGVARLDLLTRELGVLCRPAAEDRRERRLVPQHLLHRVGPRHMPPRQVGAEARIGEHHLQRVRDQVRGALERRDEHEPQMVHDLLVAEPRVVFEQPAREVETGGAVLARHQLGQRLLEERVARDRRLRALDHVASGLDQPRTVVVRHAEQRRHHQHRQRLREVVHQIAGALGAEGVDQFVGEPRDVAADAPAVEAVQAVVDRPAPALVHLPVGEDADGLPGGDGGQRVIRGEPALAHGAPVPRVAGEAGGGADHLQVLAVAEHQPRREVAVQQHGRDRPVPLAQPLVQTHRIALGLGPVQPGDPVDGAAVRRALRRRREGGLGTGVFVREGHCRSGDTVVMEWRYRMSAIKVSRDEPRSRASHSTMGTSSGRSMADRSSRIG